MDRANTDYLLGQILERTASIDEKVTRLILRSDDIERRVEALEKAEASGMFQDKLVRAGIVAILAAVGLMALKLMGIM